MNAKLGDFKLCASSTDIVKNFAVIKSVVIKRVHCTKKIISTAFKHSGNAFIIRQENQFVQCIFFENYNR